MLDNNIHEPWEHPERSDFCKVLHHMVIPLIKKYDCKTMRRAVFVYNVCCEH